MPLSKNIEYFMLLYNAKIKNACNELPYFEFNQWANFKNSVTNEIFNKLRDINIDDQSKFSCYVAQYINEDGLNDDLRRDLQRADIISDQGQIVINSYLEILDDEYKFSSNDTSVARIYLHKMIIPIFESWRTSDYLSFYPFVQKLNKLLHDHNIIYHQGMKFEDYAYNFCTGPVAYPKEGNIIFKVITLFEEIEKDMKKSRIIEKEIKKSRIIEKKCKKRGDNNIVLDDYKNLKVVGLKKLCKKLGIYKSNLLRKDYIRLIKKYKKENNL